mgnify:FL=1
MRNIFLDLGSNIGQGYERIRRQYFRAYYHPALSTGSVFVRQQSYIPLGAEVYMFEPIPDAYKFLKRKYSSSAKIYNKAIWTENTTKIFNVALTTVGSLPSKQQASNIMHKHDVDSNVESWKDVEVETIDFSEFLKNNFHPDDNIFMKMDIEGAEYPVLDQLIDTGAYKYLTAVNIEFHNRILELADKGLHTDLKPNNYYRQFFHENGITVLESSNPVIGFCQNELRYMSAYDADPDGNSIDQLQEWIPGVEFDDEYGRRGWS